MRVGITAAALLAAGLVMTGCSSGGPAAGGLESGGSTFSGPAASGSDAGGQAVGSVPGSLPGVIGADPYWTRHRLLGAQGWYHQVLAKPGSLRKQGMLPAPGSTPSPRGDAGSPRVGALFDSDSDGDHFCTASVVNSPGGDVLITAAHCINAGDGGANRTNVVFIPDYSAGSSPHGVWTPRRYVIDRRWVHGANPAFDVAFVVLKPLHDKNIQQVLGADTIAFDAGFRHLVLVSGYPSSADAPISCVNWTSKQSRYQLKFACQDFTGGTSGSPWLTRFNPVTGTGTIVGVIGGYQRGGDTAAVSYSAYLDGSIRKLYREAAGRRI